MNSSHFTLSPLPPSFIIILTSLPFCGRGRLDSHSSKYNFWETLQEKCSWTKQEVPIWICSNTMNLYHQHQQVLNHHVSCMIISHKAFPFIKNKEKIKQTFQEVKPTSNVGRGASCANWQLRTSTVMLHSTLLTSD